MLLEGYAPVRPTLSQKIVIVFDFVGSHEGFTTTASSKSDSLRFFDFPGFPCTGTLRTAVESGGNEEPG